MRQCKALKENCFLSICGGNSGGHMTASVSTFWKWPVHTPEHSSWVDLNLVTMHMETEHFYLLKS